MPNINHVLLVLLALILSSQIHARTEITPGVLYQPGSELTVPSYGIDLTVPAQWRAMLPVNSEALIMEPIGKVARMVVMAVPNSSNQAIRQLMNQSQVLDVTSQLLPSGQVQEENGIFSQTYKVTGVNPQNLVGSAYGRLGSNKTAVFVIMLEPRNQNMLPVLGKQFINSVTFSAPKSTMQMQADANNQINWAQKLRGRTLRYQSTGNGLSVTKLMNLCSDGTFSYSDKDNYGSGSLNSGFNLNSNYGQSGRWQITGNQIILSWNDGSSTQHTLSHQYVADYGEWGTFVDGERWFNNPNQVCN